MSNERYPLRQVIVDDLCAHNKVAIVLLVLIVISAFCNIWITHQTRLATTERGKLVQTHRKLEQQYIHLQLEEDSNSRKTRIEAVAVSLGLQRIHKDQEVILEQ